MDADRDRRRGPAGWTGTGACGAWTRATGWPASARRPARSTPGPARVRQSWNDPLGFVGLAGSPTPAETRDAIESRIAALRAERDDVEREAEALATSLPALEVETRALAEVSGLDGYHEERAAEVAEGEAKLGKLRARSAELRAAAEASRAYLARYDAGYRGDPRAHLHHAAHPEPPDKTSRRVFAETWAALSVGILVLALAVILWFRILPPLPTIALLVIGYLAIESFAQRRVELLLLRVTVILAADLGAPARVVLPARARAGRPRGARPVHPGRQRARDPAPPLRRD